jgi:hypothetical protein
MKASAQGDQRRVLSLEQGESADIGGQRPVRLSHAVRLKPVQGGLLNVHPIERVLPRDPQRRLGDGGVGIEQKFDRHGDVRVQRVGH